MVSIKDYAKSKGVSYEAVRKQVSRYSEELKGHISVKNRTKYLDDDAVAFLDQKRAENPIIIMESNKDDELQRLKEENDLLKNQLLEFQNKHIKYREEIDEKLHLIAQAEAQKNLLEDKQRQLEEKNKQIEEKEVQLQKERERSERAENELGKFKKSRLFFGLYKRVE